MSQEKGPRRFQYFDYLVLACFHIICFPHLSGHMFFLRPGWITFVVDCALWRAVVPWWWMCTQWSLIFHWLVVWNMAFMTFHSVGNVIIPTDELIFFRRGRSTTKQFMIPGCLGLGLGWPWPDPAPCGAMWRTMWRTHVAAEETPEPRGEGERRGVISQQFQGSQIGFSEGPMSEVQGVGPSMHLSARWWVVDERDVVNEWFRMVKT